MVINKNNSLRVFEAFAGIGSQRKALKNIQADFEIIGLAEWYIPAIISYNAIHCNFVIKKNNKSLKEMIDYLESKILSNDSKKPIQKNYWKRKKWDEINIIYQAIKFSEKEGNIFDIKYLYKRKLEDIDLLTYSFPCQDLSQQGKQNGMKKGSNTRSGLLWEIEKALEATNKNKLPQFLLMENVAAITNIRNKRDFQKWQMKLEKFGYKNETKILNSGNFGSSQARKRAFMISSLNKKIEMPIGNKKPKAIKNILNKKVLDKDLMHSLQKYHLSKFKITNSNINKAKLENYSSFNSESYVYHPNFTGPTLTASGANSRIKIKEKDKIRKMNAKEAYKYMGFETKDFNNVKKLNYLNETKMIYTCGNSISIEVLEKIMEKIVDEFKKRE